MAGDWPEWLSSESFGVNNAMRQPMRPVSWV